MAGMIDIPEGGLYKYNGHTIIAVFGGRQPNRCKHCYFNRKKIEHCLKFACREEEREDGRFIYFESYETRKGNIK